MPALQSVFIIKCKLDYKTDVRVTDVCTNQFNKIVSGLSNLKRHYLFLLHIAEINICGVTISADFVGTIHVTHIDTECVALHTVHRLRDGEAVLLIRRPLLHMAKQL
jgi:hypothetical protein